MGGGGNAGTVDFPVHIKNQHKSYLGMSGDNAIALTQSLNDVMNAALAGGNFSGYASVTINVLPFTVYTEEKFIMSIDGADSQEITVNSGDSQVTLSSKIANAINAGASNVNWFATAGTTSVTVVALAEGAAWNNKSVIKTITQADTAGGGTATYFLVEIQSATIFANEDLDFLVDGNALAVPLESGDNLTTIRDRIIAAVNADFTVGTDWTATSYSTYTAKITYNTVGSAFNGLTLSNDPLISGSNSISLNYLSGSFGGTDAGVGGSELSFSAVTSGGGVVSASGNPFSDLSFVDPTSKLTTLDSKYTSFEAFVDALDAESDWSAILSNAITGAASSDALIPMATASLMAQAVTNAASAIADNVNKAATAIDTAGVLTTIDWKTIFAEITTESLIGNNLTSVVGAVDTAGNLVPIDVVTILSDSLLKTDALMESALCAITDALDDAVVHNVVTAFEIRQGKVKSKSIRQFASTMSSLNAVQSSAFLFGLAVIEAEHLQNVSDFHANLRLELNRELLKHYYDSYRTIIAEYMKARIQEKLSREELMRTLVSQYISLAPLAVEAERVNVVSRADLIAQAMQNYSQAYANSVTSSTQAEILNKSNRDVFIQNAIRTTVEMLLSNIRAEEALVAEFRANAQMGFAAQGDYVGNELILNEKFGLWELEVFNFGANMLGAVGGGTYIPKAPPAWQQTVSTISGGLAAIGSLIK